MHKKTLKLVTEVNQSMATFLPEKFDHGEFGSRSLNVVRPLTNGLLRTRPSFLRGIAATHFHALTNAQKDSYDHLSY